MTQPRRHLAGQVVMLTRRCVQRQYLLRPDHRINRVVLYEIARASKRHGQAVHAVMAMSNHLHQISTDCSGNRSDFMRDAMREISRARNHHLNRSGSLWDNKPFGDTALLDRDAIERKLIYTWLNPVKAGLVRRAQHWPGATILPRHWGKKLRIERPPGYHGRHSPEVIEFTPMPPPQYNNMSLEEVREHFQTLLRKAEDELHNARNGKRYAGRIRICQADPFDAPKSRAPKNRLRPRFACTNAKLLSRAIAAHHKFLDDYQRQRRKWMRGKKATFPCGTIELRNRPNIRCRPPDDKEPGIFKIKREIG